MLGLDAESDPFLEHIVFVVQIMMTHLSSQYKGTKMVPWRYPSQHLKENDEEENQVYAGQPVTDYVFEKKNPVLLSWWYRYCSFMSIVRDIETYNKFKNVYLFYTVRTVNEPHI